jgi:hypothetical protein
MKNIGMKFATTEPWDRAAGHEMGEVAGRIKAIGEMIACGWADSAEARGKVSVALDGLIDELTEARAAWMEVRAMNERESRKIMTYQAGDYLVLVGYTGARVFRSQDLELDMSDAVLLPQEPTTTDDELTIDANYWEQFLGASAEAARC